jgi:hypothetical protein
LIDGTDMPRRSPGQAHASPADGALWLSQVAPEVHAIQFYEDEDFLVETVGRFLAAGIDAGERVIVVADEQRRSSLIRDLVHVGCEPDRATFLSAHDTLSRFMRGGMPDAAAFAAFVDCVLKGARARSAGACRARVYGEMVDLLWRNGNAKAALRLEDLWNEAAEAHEFARLCACATETFNEAGDIERFLELCDKHSHVLPTEAFTELLDDGTRPEYVGALERRGSAQIESDVAFRELIVPFRPRDDQPVDVLVGMVVEEIRAANPGRTVEFHVECRCVARMDPERFRQMISTLVDNALEHGDARPITVTVSGTPDFVHIGVHNHGPPIRPASMPLLFDAFHGTALHSNTGSLGLGLYLCDRITAAHGGRIDVRSSEEEGTCFEVVMPTRA